MSQHHILFTGDRDSGDEHDFVGAFKPEADRYQKYWQDQGDSVELHRVDLSQKSHAARVTQMVKALREGEPVDRFVCCCHGWPTGMQLGLSSDTPEDRDALAAFATVLSERSTPKLQIALYCCSTGKSEVGCGIGSFADRLRMALVAAGRPDVTVFAHSTAGHTTRNPAVRFFLPKQTGGVDLAEPGTAAWRKLDERLHAGRDPLRWQLPYMELDDARSALA